MERTSSITSEQLLNLTTAPLLHPLWSITNVGPVLSQPVVQNGIVYFGDQGGNESAAYASNGTLLWKTFLGIDHRDDACGAVGVTSTAAVEGSVLYVDGGHPYMYALNTSTGAIDWSSLIGESTELSYDWSSPLIYGNNAYIGISSGCDSPLVPAGVDEISLSTHKVVGTFNTSTPSDNGSSIWGSISVNPATNTIFFTTGNAYHYDRTTYDDSIIALNATTLALVASWQLPIAELIVDSDFGVTPTIFTPPGGFPMVTASNKNGELYAFYQSNLTLAWQQRICCRTAQGMDKNDSHISTAYGGGYVYAVGSVMGIGGVNYNSSVTAFDPLSGAIVWKDVFPGDPMNGYAAPLWVNGVLVVLDGGSLIVLNSNTGALLRQMNIGTDFVAAPSISRGEVFAGSYAGVFAYDVLLNSSATQSRATGPASLSDSFSVTGSGGLPNATGPTQYGYRWNFGDGTPESAAQSPKHRYTSAGTYSVTVSVTDLAGSVSRDTLSVEVGGSPNALKFNEKGLPSATAWSVLMDGISTSSTTKSLSVKVPDGTYAYAVALVPGFSASPGSGSVTVSGSGQSILVTFKPVYSVTFTESGLPSGTVWSSTLDGVQLFSTNSFIAFNETMGTYSYTVDAFSGYLIFTGYAISPPSGSLTVAGSDLGQLVMFKSDTYLVTFTETGLPSESTWLAWVNWDWQFSNTTSLIFAEPNGTYTFSLGALSGYVASPTSGTFTVSGAALTKSITFKALTRGTYPVTFTETGLPSGTNWSVTVSGTLQSTTGLSIVFAESNGTYRYAATLTGGTGGASVPFTVSGALLGLTVQFFKTSFNEANLATGTRWQVTANGFTESSTGTSNIFYLTNGTYSYTIAPIPGYRATSGSYTGTFTVNGANRVVTVDWTQVTYAVKFAETGLAKGTSWSVTIDGKTKSGTGGSISFSLPNGTYPFAVSAAGYTGTPSSPSPLTVEGAAVTLTVTFTASSNPDAVPAPEESSTSAGPAVSAKL